MISIPGSTRTGKPSLAFLIPVVPWADAAPSELTMVTSFEPWRSRRSRTTRSWCSWAVRVDWTLDAPLGVVMKVTWRSSCSLRPDG